MENSPKYLGNKELLKQKKVCFIASRNISSLSILPTLDWATEVSKREDNAIVSGFHSKMERNVLEILLKGQCGIIIVLARGMYRKLPKQYEEAMSQNRLLIISNEKDNVKRVSEQTAHKRNEFVREIADKMMQLKIQ